MKVESGYTYHGPTQQQRLDFKELFHNKDRFGTPNIVLTLRHTAELLFYLGNPCLMWDALKLLPPVERSALDLGNVPRCGNFCVKMNAFPSAQKWSLFKKWEGIFSQKISDIFLIFVPNLGCSIEAVLTSTYNHCFEPKLEK